MRSKMICSILNKQLNMNFTKIMDLVIPLQHNSKVHSTKLDKEIQTSKLDLTKEFAKNNKEASVLMKVKVKNYQDAYTGMKDAVENVSENCV